MTQPEWALPIIEQVCKDHKRRLPKMRWVKRNRRSTSGVTYTYERKITICIGFDTTQHLPVLLHELAHYVCPKKSHHNKRFWLKLSELLKQFDCFTESYVKQEYNYKKKAELYL